MGRASLKAVGDSKRETLKYKRDNLVGTLNLLLALT